MLARSLLPDKAPNFGDYLVAGILANYSAMPKRKTQLTRISADRETYASANAFFASGEVLAKLLERQDILRDYAPVLKSHVPFFDHCRTGGAIIPIKQNSRQAYVSKLHRWQTYAPMPRFESGFIVAGLPRF